MRKDIYSLENKSRLFYDFKLRTAYLTACHKLHKKLSKATFFDEYHRKEIQETIKRNTAIAFDDYENKYLVIGTSTESEKLRNQVYATDLDDMLLPYFSYFFLAKIFKKEKDAKFFASYLSKLFPSEDVKISVIKFDYTEFRNEYVKSLNRFLNQIE